MDYTKEYIKEQLSTDVRWMERCLLLLYRHQTEDEKSSEITRWYNNVGFNGRDSKYLTYVSKWLLKGNRLTGSHIEKCGRMLPKYWKQVQEEIIRKQGGQ